MSVGTFATNEVCFKMHFELSVSISTHGSQHGRTANNLPVRILERFAGRSGTARACRLLTKE